MPAGQRKTSARRVGAEQSATRTVLIDATEQLMLEEGYAAVSTRRVAAKVGLTPALVHYYFPTTEDLLLATYRRSAERHDQRLQEILTADDLPRAMWNFSVDVHRTGLGMEFMAMANHRKSIRAEIARHIAHTRKIQSQALAKLRDNPAFDWDKCPPACLAMVLAALSRAFVMEEALGVSDGHKETAAFVAWWLDQARGETRTSHTSRPKKGSSRRG